uniref:Fucolectin tachylectin-4 pentraxin-1 domain-containing protein n=1 Tax=Maylandia zebra TaxID=106582 RepID=A0A3P9DI06_9CICH
MLTTAGIYVLLSILGKLSGNLETNVARLGQVSQSSKYGNAKPENAIDGNRASNFNQGSCACTNNNLNPWWRLDLLKTYKINTVTITNRQDCCPERINGAEIRIGNSLNDNGNANPRCAVISSIAAGASQTFACNGMEGRYINIVIPGRTEYLTLCEVEVDGTLSGKSCPILLVCSTFNEHIMVFGVLLIILMLIFATFQRLMLPDLDK